MKGVVKTFTVVLVTSLVVFLLPSFLSTNQQTAVEKTGYAYLADVEKLQTAYNEWQAKHEEKGGDRNITLLIGWSKGLSTEFTRASGWVKLDLIDGWVSVEVDGLANEEIWHVWLVDNQPGPEHSVLPEPGDRMIHVGQLSLEGDSAELAAHLGAHAFQDFEVDLVVISRGGRGPWQERGSLRLPTSL